MQITQLQVSTGSELVTFATKKGLADISVEGALFKGGAALAALKDQALESALLKAGNGKYRAAYDVLAAAFPQVAKKVDAFYETAAWTNKDRFSSLIMKCGHAEGGKNGYNKKQVSARLLIQALCPLLGVSLTKGDVVENVEPAAEQQSEVQTTQTNETV